jgi:tetratricopeptide (TPR) repeat protein
MWQRSTKISTTGNALCEWRIMLFMRVSTRTIRVPIYVLVMSLATCALVAMVVAQQGNSGHRAEVCDRDEQVCFLVAKRETENSAKAVKLEAFLKQYPDSVHKEEALEVLVDTYERLGNLAEVEATTDRLLQDNPDNLLGLWSKAKLFRYTDAGQLGNYQRNLELAKLGLRRVGEVSKPQEMNPADFDKQRSEMSLTFNSVAGSAALKMKDFYSAQHYLRAAVDSDPDDFGNVYQLALAYLLSEPAEPTQGLFFVARAENLAPTASREKLDVYGKEQCIRYYDSDRSWPLIKATAKTHTTPPSGFTIDRLK